MAEAVASFGLAANVLQFIEFGSKLANNFWSVYMGYRDGPATTLEMEKLTRNLQDVITDLQTSGQPEDQLEPGIQRLAGDCKEVAKELLTLLGAITGQMQTSSKRSILKAVLKTLWKEEDILRVQRRLEAFRSELMLNLIASLRTQVRKSEDQQALILEGIGNVLRSTNDIQSKVEQRAPAVEELGPRIIDMVVSKIAPAERSQEKEQLEKYAIDELLKSNDKMSSETPVMTPQRFQQMTRRILVRLHFNAIQDRVENIADAHKATFKWIFKNGDDNDDKGPQAWTIFSQWLMSSTQLYWVTGKPGSGKSTLMKYIGHSQITEASTTSSWELTRSAPYLAQWAPSPLRLIVASYFFWNSGTSLQMSQLGLLRSLLHQIFSQEPSLISVAAPARWEALCLFGADNAPEWTLTELLNMLHFAITHLPDDIRLCLFIDGLDEFDGDHSALVNLCKEMVRSPNVKLCVASRPWEVFENAFHQQASLRMEDLTYADIEKYVSTELTTAPDFSILEKRYPISSNRLITNIVEKASGVFLWVRLVVSSLLAGMRHGDRLEDFQKRLDLLPPELERLYDKMLDSLDPFYLEHAAQLFTLVQVSKEPIALGLMSFIDDETCNSLTRKPSAFLDPQALYIRYETMQRRINSRTKGLLEVARSKEPLGIRSVQYLHRTVHDYMESDEVRKRLQTAMVRPFDSHLHICTGILAYLKLVDLTYWTSDLHSALDQLLVQFMTYARLIERQHRLDLVRLMDELSNSLVPLSRAISLSSSRSVSAKENSGVPHYDFASIMTESYPRSHFYRIAVHFGISGYIQTKPIKGFLVKFDVGQVQINYSLIADAFGIFNIGEHSPWTIPGLEPHVELIADMLRMGAHSSYTCQIGTTEIAQTDLILALCEMVLNGDVVIGTTNHQAWSEGIQLLIRYHDQHWSASEIATWTMAERKRYHLALIQHYDAFSRLRQGVLLNGLKQKTLSLPKLLGLTPHRHARQIHHDRLQVLHMLQARIQRYEVVSELVRDNDSEHSIPIKILYKPEGWGRVGSDEELSLY